MVDPAASSGDPDAVRFGLLGPLQVVDATGREWPVRAAKQRIMLAALLLGAGSAISRDRMAEILWDTSAPADPAAAMRTYAMRLRRALGPAGIRVMRQPPGWAIALHDADELDLITVKRLRESARVAAEAHNWKLAAEQLTEALSCWRGEPLVDIPSTALARREAVHLGELRLMLTEARIDAGLRLGRHSELVTELRRLTAEHPLREHIRVQLMLACYRCGNQAEALAVYRDAYQTLAGELGVVPGPAMQDIQRQILASDRDLLVYATDPAMLRDRAAGYRHGLPLATGTLAGREAEVELIASARSTVIISGMPGAGKTALAVHAAHLLAASFPDRQIFIDLHGHTPGRNPVSPAAALAELIAATGTGASSLPADLPGRSAMWRDRLSGQRTVLVLDNAATSEQVTPLLPGTRDCLVLVTSRRQLADLPGPLAPVWLPALSGESARGMFLALSPRAASEDPALVDELTGLAGQLPLAISLLARLHARHLSWTLPDLIAQARTSLLTMTAEQASISRAFSSSWRRLRPVQRRLLALLSLRPGMSTDEQAAAAAGIPVADAAWQLDKLHHECLLTETGYRRYHMHRLIRAYASAQAQTVLTSGGDDPRRVPGLGHWEPLSKPHRYHQLELSSETGTTCNGI